MADIAEQFWRNAQKVRRGIVKETEQMKDGKSSGRETACFTKLDDLMKDFRLACVQTLVADMSYASQEEVDTVLWQMHSYINSRFRRTIKELPSPHQAVVKRKVEKMYLEFLRTSQYFYRGFLQRLCAHYRIPRLEQLAQSLQLEAPESATEDSANDVTVDSIGGLVLAVCHRLLIALGDLARYKGQVRKQSHTSFTALSYYALANDLLPASGWGHHQMGVIHLDDKKHFDILYHFFRAWAAELPHPNAASNLDLELRELLQPAAPTSHLALDVLKTRFVWLQALSNRGEPFRQHEELEKEVLSRFKTALNNRENGDTLLQVLLVNACSYQYALERFQEKETESASRSARFVLRLNVRMIDLLADTVASELDNLVKQDISSPKNNTGTESVKSSSLIETSLPLLRIAMFWLAIHIQHVTSQASHFGSELEGMYRTVSAALTGLLEVYGSTKLVSIPYMLSEDLEIQGIRMFEAADLEAPFKLLYDDKDQRKPRLADTVGVADVDSHAELLGRAFDILKFGFFLAGNSAVPFAVESAPRDGRQVTTVRYVDASTEAQELATSPRTEQAKLGSAVDARLDDGMADLRLHDQMRVQSTPDHLAINRNEQRVAHDPQATASASALSHSAVTPGESLSVEDSSGDFDEDRLMHMVGDFLAPPESEKRNAAAPGQVESSYDMHTSTANEIWQRIDPAQHMSLAPPNSAGGKGFPSLPWNYFLPPTPTQQQYPAQQQGPSTMTPPDFGPGQASFGQASPPPESGVNMSLQGSIHLDDPFAMRNDVRQYNNLVAVAPEGSASSRAEAEQYMLSSKGLNYQEQANRSTHNVQPSSAQQQTPGQSWTRPSPNTMAPGRQFSHGHDRLSTPGNRANPTATAIQSIGSSATLPSTNFSRSQPSQLRVNSPWGLPNAQRQRQDNTQFNAQLEVITGLATSSSGGSLHSSSTITPGLTHNGITYTGTTAYGRGTIVPAKDDPTYFKNAIKTSGMADVVAEADEYDRKVLASALEDDKSSRRT